VIRKITFSVVDPSAALQESRDARARETRARFLAKAMTAGAAVVTGGVVVAGFPRSAFSKASPAQDLQVLNVLLLLEYVQAAFYREANARGALKGEVQEFAETVGGHEDEHVAFIKGVLGAKARAKPRTAFGRATRNQRAFVAAAIALEDLAVTAYNGQATNVTRKTLAPAATIVSVEARHAAWIRDIGGRLPAIAAVDKAVGEAKLLAGLRKSGLRSSP
jgi:hypothetical protein